MPYGPDREIPKETPLADEEQEERIRRLQAEQEARLRRALGDDLFDWIRDFEGDSEVLGQEPLKD